MLRYNRCSTSIVTDVKVVAGIGVAAPLVGPVSGYLVQVDQSHSGREALGGAYQSL